MKKGWKVPSSGTMMIESRSVCCLAIAPRGCERSAARRKFSCTVGGKSLYRAPQLFRQGRTGRTASHSHRPSSEIYRRKVPPNGPTLHSLPMCARKGKTGEAGSIPHAWVRVLSCPPSPPLFFCHARTRRRGVLESVRTGRVSDVRIERRDEKGDVAAEGRLSMNEDSRRTRVSCSGDFSHSVKVIERLLPLSGERKSRRQSVCKLRKRLLQGLTMKEEEGRLGVNLRQGYSNEKGGGQDLVT